MFNVIDVCDAKQCPFAIHAVFFACDARLWTVHKSITSLSRLWCATDRVVNQFAYSKFSSPRTHARG